MNIFSRLMGMIRQVIGKMIPYRSIEQAEHVESSISSEMITALDLWHDMYTEKAPWMKVDTVKSLNLPAFISSEIARQVTLEMKWNITGVDASGNTSNESGEEIVNPRAQYLHDEFQKLVTVLRQKLEIGCAAGGMVIKPYVNTDDGHIYFDWVMDWGLYPLSFDDDGNLNDVILPDVFVDGKTYYTRLERHQVKGNAVIITQRAFKSNQPDQIGTEVPLTSVERWAALPPEITLPGLNGALFGWFKAAAANNVDVDSPLGSSVYAKAIQQIKEADLQYSRLLWEFEGGELAIDVDPTALRPRIVDGRLELPQLNERLFRKVDIDKNGEDLYSVFSPALRDVSLKNGLNTILRRVEDLTGLSAGTISDENVEARTATELRINKQRSYATIADNQAALERCLRDVIRVMDFYATYYNLAPEGEYDVSFDWDDSILTDSESQMNERMLMLNNGMISKVEFRMWYFGETKAQAQQAIENINKETVDTMAAIGGSLPELRGDGEGAGGDDD